jgi:hypothetical protein
MKRAAIIAALSVLALTACGGGGGQPPFRTESASDTALIRYTNNACVVDITVHSDRTAQSQSTCPANWLSTTTTLPATIVSPLFGDLQSAQPLNALLACPTSSGIPNQNVSMSIAWNGQQSPNVGTCTGTGTAEQNLAYDIADVVVSFEPLP